MKCNNCGAKLSCGCQRKTAKDGKSCCTNCVNKYNKTLGENTTNELETSEIVSNSSIKAYFTMN